MHTTTPTAKTWPRQGRFLVGVLIKAGGLGIAASHLLGR